MTSQCQVLNKILQSQDFSIVTTNNLTQDYFFNYKNEFNFIQQHYKTYGKVPDKITFLGTFPEFDYIEVNEPDNYLLSQLFNDYNDNYLAITFNKIKKLLESGESEKAQDYYVNSLENLHRGSALTCTNLITDKSRFDRYKERMTDNSKYYFSTGFSQLDRLIGGIDKENENLVIAARTGIGKTYTMLKMAAACAKQGLTVGIFEGEMTADKVGYRLDTILADGALSNTNIMRGNAWEQAAYENYMNKLDLQHWGNIKVLTPNDVAGHKVTVDVLRAFIEKEKLEVLFVDQYSLLEDTSHARTSFERVGNIAKEIKQLQVEKKLPIISVSQMNRTKNDDGSQDTTQIGLSDMIGQYATVVLMLDKKDDQLFINIVKSRDGGDNKKLTYKIDLDRGIFEYIPTENDGVSSHEDLNAVGKSYEKTTDEAEDYYDEPNEDYD